jgi:hypothetical protein
VAPGALVTDLDLIELARGAEASDLGSGPLDLLNVAVDGMCGTTRALTRSVPDDTAVRQLGGPRRARGMTVRGCGLVRSRGRPPRGGGLVGKRGLSARGGQGRPGTEAQMREVVRPCGEVGGWPTRLGTTRLNPGRLAARRGHRDEAVSLSSAALRLG